MFSESNEQKIALSGEISALTNPLVNLSRTITLLDLDSVYFLDEASVELLTENDSYSMTSIGNGYYRAEGFLTQAGETYTINCSANNLPPASATIYVPELPDMSSLTYSVDEEFIMHLSLNIADPAELDDYYSFFLAGWQTQHRYSYDSERIETIDTMIVYGKYHINMRDSVMEYTEGYRSFNEVDDNNRWGSEFFFSDRLINGSSYQLSIDISLLNTYNDSIPEIEFHFNKRDEHFFSYFISLMRYDPYPDLPVMQPVHIYSNIDGGFGLLTGSAKFTYVIDASEWYEDPNFLELKLGN